MKKTKNPLNLKRPHRVMIRFNTTELKNFHHRVANTGLSQAEYGRRKCLDVPIAEIRTSQS